MDLDRGLLARIDRKLLAGLGGNEEYRTVRVPSTAARWSTWRRYCESAGISMGRAVTLFIPRELIAVFGDVNGGGRPVFGQRARDQRSALVSKLPTRDSTVRAKNGRNERCPCGSGRKQKHCYGLVGRRTYCRLWSALKG